MSGLGVYVCAGIDEYPRNLRTIPPDQLEQERIAIRGFRIRYCSAQLVTMQSKDLQAGKLAQLWRHRSRQLVIVEVQPTQVGEGAKFARYFTAQLVTV